MTAGRNSNFEAAYQATIQGRYEQAIQLLGQESLADPAGRRLTIELHQRIVRNLEEGLDAWRWDQVIAAWGNLRKLEGEAWGMEALEARLMEGLDAWVSGRVGRVSDQELVGTLQGFLDAGIAVEAMERRKRVFMMGISAQKLAGMGRFAEAESMLRGMAPSEGGEWLKLRVEGLRRDHERAKALLTEIHRAADTNRWQEVKVGVESLLELAPRHPVGNQMLRRLELEMGVRGGFPSRKQEQPNMISAAKYPGSHRPDKPVEELVVPKHPILWIDGVGGYLLLDADEIVIGQASPGNQVDLMVVGDLSRRAAAIRRSGDDHLLQPLQSLSINDTKIDRAIPLQNGDVISLAPRVQARYSRPNALSLTARLDLLSRHRWQPSVDGVLLMGDTCILGPSSHSHVLCPFWTEDVMLVRHRGGWVIKSSQALEKDGKSVTGPVSLEAGKRIRGVDFSMTLE